MKLEKTLDIIHAAARRNTVLQIFTAFNRLLLGFAFIPPSIKKILHEPFSLLPDSNPVGHYFNALYQTGFYYEFIGWGQLIAALLLLFPRTAHIGALLFFPIILNIAVLTSSVGFQGTWLITALMALAALYLVAWDYDRWKQIVFGKLTGNSRLPRLEFLIVPGFFGLGGACLGLLVYFLAAGNPMRNSLILFTFFPGAGFIFGLLVALHHKFMKVGVLERSDEMP